MPVSALIVKLPLPGTMKKLRRPSSTSSKTATLDTGSPRGNPTFNQSQAALALCLLKSLPEGTSTIDYRHQLRKHIKAGHTTPQNELRYIDTAEFWKDQYTKVHLEKKGLQDRINCLEEKQRVLGDQFAIGDYAPPSEAASRQSFRLPDGVNIGGETNPRKRQASAVDVEEAEFQYVDIQASLEVDNTLRLSSYVLRLARTRKQLDRVTQESRTLDQLNEVTKHTFQVLSVLESTISDCFYPLRRLRTNSKDAQCLCMIQQVSYQVHLSYLACFNAMNEHSRTILGRNKVTEIVYKMAMFFNRVLKLFQTIGSQQSNSGLYHQSKRARTEESEYAIAKYLSNTLSSISSAIEWQEHRPAHCELLEGILFLVLDYTGKLISESVFGEHVASSKVAGNMTESVGPALVGFTRPESRYLVQILHSILGGPSREELVAKILASRIPTAGNQGSGVSSCSSQILLTRAKKLLHSTLMKSTVGGYDLETLKLPAPPLETYDGWKEEAEAIQKYGPEWLVETVWSLIGWNPVI